MVDLGGREGISSQGSRIWCNSTIGSSRDSRWKWQLDCILAKTLDDDVGDVGEKEGRGEEEEVDGQKVLYHDMSLAKLRPPSSRPMLQPFCPSCLRAGPPSVAETSLMRDMQ